LNFGGFQAGRQNLLVAAAGKCHLQTGGDHASPGTEAARRLVSWQRQRLPGGNRAFCGRDGATARGHQGLRRHRAPRRLVFFRQGRGPGLFSQCQGGPAPGGRSLRRAPGRRLAALAGERGGLGDPLREPPSGLGVLRTLEKAPYPGRRILGGQHHRSAALHGAILFSPGQDPGGTGAPLPQGPGTGGGRGGGGPGA